MAIIKKSFIEHNQKLKIKILEPWNINKEIIVRSRFTREIKKQLNKQT